MSRFRGSVLPRLTAVAFLLALALQSRAWAQGGDIQVEALLTGMIVFSVDGQRKTLRVGESFAGIRLIEADASRAVVEVGGERRELGVSTRIGSRYEEPEKREVSIPRNSLLQYRTTATINGQSAPVLVDTGANVVAMNAGQARSLGVDYQSGTLMQVETAGGVLQGWQVKLDSVDVGGLRAEGVQATVLEGSHPVTVLLGMSYLQHVQIRESKGVLFLYRDW